MSIFDLDPISERIEGFHLVINRVIPVRLDSIEDLVSPIRVDVLSDDLSVGKVGSIWFRMLDFLSETMEDGSEVPSQFEVADLSGDTLELFDAFFDDNCEAVAPGLDVGPGKILFLDAFYLDPKFRGIKGFARRILKLALSNLIGQFDMVALKLVPFELGDVDNFSTYGRQLIHFDPETDKDEIETRKGKLAGFYSSIGFRRLDKSPDWMYWTEEMDDEADSDISEYFDLVRNELQSEGDGDEDLLHVDEEIPLIPLTMVFELMALSIQHGAVESIRLGLHKRKDPIKAMSHLIAGDYGKEMDDNILALAERYLREIDREQTSEPHSMPM
jgi:hypothetical protein